MSLAVIFLARGAPGGLDAAQAFFKAYRQFPADCPHDLIIATKGWKNPQELDAIQYQARALSATIIDLPDDGFDWGAYMRIAPQISHSYICLLNTHSRPAIEGWLNILRLAFENPEVGAAGATGSLGSLSITQPKPDRHPLDLILFPLRFILAGIRFIQYIQRFPAFPNPHLRSNAILIQRELFLSFISQHSIPRSKSDAHAMESGRNGLTHYLRSKGLKSVVVAANGQSYLTENWIDSQTFRVPGQAQLIVKDNQTDYYQNASPKLRRRLEQAAWGCRFTPE